MMYCGRKFLVILLLSLLTFAVKGQTAQADSSQVAVATVESEMIFSFFHGGQLHKIAVNLS